jgi:hypothetical protein
MGSLWSKYLRSVLLGMHKTTLEQLLSFILGHFGLRLIAVTEHYLVKFFGTRLAVHKHF